MTIKNFKDKILAGGQLTVEEALWLADIQHFDPQELWDAAAEITAKFSPRKFDSCSIVNARSGKCSEDCKWCAQSAHYSTGAAVYPLVDKKTCLDLAEYNREQGVGRYSLVASGRAVTGAALDKICDYYEEMTRRGGVYLCASLGLLGRPELEKLRAAGVERYHCNLETAPSHFSTLCTTHTQEEKIATLREARAVGMEICSGGIIGMGETHAQRVELAVKLREVEPDSIPINILHPIEGTPLAEEAPLTREEVLTTVAVFRLIHPRVALRFAGGRDRISPETQREALRVGINGAIMGDLLTTIGSQIAADREMVRECGYEF